MKLDGINIKNFRSFDKEGCIIEDFGKVNVFIGKNNSGKSNVLAFISKLPLLIANNSNVPPFKEEDYFDYEEGTPISFQIKHGKTKTLTNLLENNIEIDKYLNKAEYIWLEYAPTNSDRVRYSISDNNIFWFTKLMPQTSREIGHLRNQILNDQLQANPQIIFKDLFKKIIKSKELISNNIYLIGNYRRIESKENRIEDINYQNNLFNGANLIRELNKLKNPPSKIQKTEKEKFYKIQNFIRDILEVDGAEINIDNDVRELSINNKGKQIPIENLGAGIHQLIILAISVTVHENCIFCIEEPEIFLHPEIQKKFMNFLLKTNNQYFITTHSNSFINIHGLDIYHVTHDGNKTHIDKVLNSENKNQILDDLGYHASDILQTNYLLWVEGPSDRIYLNHWIKEKDSSLIEGIHYSIMFYGGSLRSHLKVDESSVSDFIKLNKINRNVGIIQDSDKESESDSINQTKERLIKEFSELGYFNWLTQGREIENYLSKPILISSIKEITANENPKVNENPFSKAYEFKIDKSIFSVEKINLAKTATKFGADFKILDLDKKTTELINAIKKANNKA